jgi:DNA-binding transcriptional LysR family regulator
MLWNLNLRHLRAMSAIATAGTISSAARAISITQPAITQGLAKLESLLGTPMFERQSDGMRATAAANMLIPRIDRALAFIGSPRVTISQMRALLAVGEAGTYLGASKITGLSQPTLHRALADLSIALGCRIVERRGKGIGFTDSGWRTIRGFRLARAELEAGLSELAQLKGYETGRISVGAMPLSRARVLPAAIAAFHARFPSVKISIAEGAFSELIEPLRDGDLDLMVGALRDPSPGQDIEQQPLFSDQPAIFARFGHPLAGTSPSIKDLAGFPWIVPSVGAPLYAQWRKMFDACGIELPPVPVQCGSVMTTRQILVATDFLTLLSPDQVSVELQAKWLVTIAKAPDWLSRTIGISTRTGWQPTALQKAFMEQLFITAQTG